MHDKNTRYCRFCGENLENIFVALGMSPLANAYIDEENKNKQEVFYPLNTYICKKCFLVQALVLEMPENIFTNYFYFSSYSKNWLEHCKTYATDIIQKLNLNKSSFVIEIASNDGYLLQYFKEKNINILGIEPAQNIAKTANEKGIHTISGFFSENFAKILNKKADLIIANNVLAHVPDINSFVKGFKIILKENGSLTVEFPSLLNLIQYNQFDTIYHEHFSYLSFTVVCSIFKFHGLKVYDVEKLNTHGGSLRVYVCHNEYDKKIETSVNDLLNEENYFGITDLNMYGDFKDNVVRMKRNILKELIQLKEADKKIIGYGAAAKGNTLLNYCGIKEDFIDYVVDVSPHKQNKYLPGTHIPIRHPNKIMETKPDYVIILPWNLKDEIAKQLSFIRQWDGKFITFIPKTEVF